MGGAALGRQAQRLTTPQFHRLVEYCIQRLSPSFFPRVVALKPFTDKDSHGDIDLLCSWDEQIDAKKVKGEDWGVIVEGEDKGVGAHHPIQTLSLAKRIEEKEQKDGAENREFRKWVIALAGAIEGTEWKRSGASGAVISIGVPCRVLESVEGHPKDRKDDVRSGKPDYEPFYQVDLQLVPARYIEFTAFTRSFSNVILSHAISYLSHCTKLHGTHLGIRYLPYVGIEPIKVELTSSPVELCEWLGLDVERMERGFDNEKQLWQWATKVAPGGKIDKAWRIITNPKRKSREGKGKTRKAGAWSIFVVWLRTGEDSPYEYRRHKISESDTSGSNVVKAQKGVSAIDTPETRLGIKTTSDLPDLTDTHVVSVVAVPATAQTLNTEVKTGEPLSGSTARALTPAQRDAQRSLVDPDFPKLLDKTARETIDRFGKMREIEALLHERRQQAILLAEKQKKKSEQDITSEGQVAANSDTTAPSTQTSQDIVSLALQVEELAVAVAEEKTL